MNLKHGNEMAMTPGPSPSAAADRERWIALVVLCVGVLMIILDSTVVNVALPSIQQDLGFSQANLAWVVNAYLISFGGLLLLAGRLGDLIGRRRVFLVGLALFTVASLSVRLSQSQVVPDRRSLRAGDRRRTDVRGDPRDGRDDVPRAAGAGQGDRRLQLCRGSAGASIGLLLGGVVTQSSTGTGSSSSTCRSAS